VDIDRSKPLSGRTRYAKALVVQRRASAVVLHRAAVDSTAGGVTRRRKRHSAVRGIGFERKISRYSGISPDNVQVRKHVAAAVAIDDIQEVRNSIAITGLRVIDNIRKDVLNQVLEVERRAGGCGAVGEVVGGAVESVGRHVGVVRVGRGEPVDEGAQLVRLFGGEEVEGIAGAGGEFGQVVEHDGGILEKAVDGVDVDFPLVDGVCDVGGDGNGDAGEVVALLDAIGLSGSKRSCEECVDGGGGEVDHGGEWLGGDLVLTCSDGPASLTRYDGLARDLRPDSYIFLRVTGVVELTGTTRCGGLILTVL
jgi:hypothetical protein